MLKFKISKKTQLIYVFHEPFDSFINYYKSGFKLFKIVKMSLVNLISLVTTLLCNTIILPSKKAVNLYKKKGVFFNKNYFNLPLMFDNETQALFSAIIAFWFGQRSVNKFMGAK